MMKNNIYIVIKCILLFCLIAGYPLVPLYCQNMIIDGTTYSTGQQLYFSPGIITSPDSCSKPVQVTGDANITYKAVQYVHLGGGFSTALSGYGTFHACTGNRPQACPVAIITGDPVSCGPSLLSAVSSINDSGTITAYQWQMNGKKINGATSISYTASLSGDYTVLVTNSYNCTAISMVYPVTIIPIPIVDPASNVIYCNDAITTAINFTGSIAGTTFAWTNSAPSIGLAASGTGNIPSFTATNTGSTPVVATITVTPSANGCNGTPMTFTITVNPIIVPTITGYTNMCINFGPMNYTTEPGMTGYFWTVSPGNLISGGQGTNIVQIIWSVPGVQWVKVTYANALGCTPVTSTQLNVSVEPLPGPAGTITGTTAICGGTKGVYYSVAPIANAVSYVWTLPYGATIATGQFTNSITVDFGPFASSGNITVYGSNICGNGPVSPPFAVTVDPLPDTAGMIAGETSVCQGASGVVYSVATIANASGYTWTIPAGATIVTGANTNSITIDFSLNAISGMIEVYGTNSCGNGAVGQEFHVTLNPISTVSVSLSPSSNPVCTGSPVTLTAMPVNGGTAVYQWYVNGILVFTGTANYTYVPANGDEVYVVMTSGEPCVSGNPATSNTVVMTVNPNILPVTIVPSDGNISSATRAPGNTWKYQRTEYLVTAAEMAASGFLSGHEINSIGFTIATAGGTTQAGTYKIWLKNTTDATYTLGTTWTTAGFTQVSNKTSWNVPIAVGGYDVPFTGGSAFTYTGGGVYVAWEFSNSGSAGTTAVGHYCNVSLANGLVSNRSNSALPTTLVASSIRPATTFTSSTLIDITTLTNIYCYERVPVPFGICPPPEVRVCNVSCTPQSFDVTLTAKDAATGTTRFTDTQAVNGLAAGASTIVSFTCWNLTILENVNITATTSVIGVENLVADNTRTIPANVNNNLYSYNYSTTGSSPFGFTYPGAGIFASRFTMNGPGKIPGANIVIANYAANTGKTVYAVVLDNTGAIVAQSANHVIAAGELGTNVSFTFPTPPVFINEIFYVGLAQTSGTAQYYPVGTFPESPVRTNTFYFVDITGGTPEILTGFDLKYGIEAQVGTVTLPAHDVGTVSVNMARVVTLGSNAPAATVRNYGANTETFNVTMMIGACTSTRSVLSLASGAFAQVTFDPWTNSLGDYTAQVCTQLSGDLNVSNDCKTNAIKVLDLNKAVYGYNAYPDAGTDPAGPMTFTLSNPGNLASIANQSALQFVSGGTWADGSWYGTVYNTANPYYFIMIDPVTGARTVIGDMGIQMNSLSYNPATGSFYTEGYNGTSSTLYVIDITTGAPTIIGSAAGVLLANLAINNAGQAYAVDLNADVLGTINLSTGAFTVIGSIGFDAQYAQDMEFDRDANVLFMAAEDANSGWLAWVDVATGNTLKIGDFEGGADVTGFAIPYAGARILNLKAFLEGLYDGGITMRQALDEYGPHFSAGIADQVKVELHNASNYSVIEYTSGLVDLTTSGNITIPAIPAIYSGSYYITIRHRNSIETTSSSPVSFAGSVINYDFTSAASQAYGDNQKKISGKWSVWGADVNQDGIVDASDMNYIDNSSTAITFGYVVEDVNGDGIVDGSDMNIVDNNATAIIMAMTP